MRTVIRFALLCGGLLLLLSALIVPTAETVPSAATVETAAAFDLMAMPPEQTADAGLHTAVKAKDSEPMQLFAPKAWEDGALPFPHRDANGRVLTHARYEKSVYQLFRMEVAAG